MHADIIAQPGRSMQGGLPLFLERVSAGSRPPRTITWKSVWT